MRGEPLALFVKLADSAFTSCSLQASGWRWGATGRGRHGYPGSRCPRLYMATLDHNTRAHKTGHGNPVHIVFGCLLSSGLVLGR